MASMDPVEQLWSQIEPIYSAPVGRVVTIEGPFVPISLEQLLEPLRRVYKGISRVSLPDDESSSIRERPNRGLRRPDSARLGEHGGGLYRCERWFGALPGDAVEYECHLLMGNLLVSVAIRRCSRARRSCC